MSQRGARMTEFEERDYYSAPRRSDTRSHNGEYHTRRVATRSPPASVRERESAPSFLRDDARRAEAGPMVLRKRDIETWDRRPRSESPHFHGHGHDHERSRTRVVEKERERVRSPSVVRRRSPSLQSVRFVERRRSPSPHREHIHTRITERERQKEKEPSPSPSPPSVLRGPIIEREVITHYTDIDHGVIRAKVPSPSPPPRPRAHTHTRERETDIDISLSKNRTEVDVDIHRSTSRRRSPSHERHRPYDDDDMILRRDMERVRIGDRHNRRSRSAIPIASPADEEAEYITSKVDSRGRIGEAYHGATRDWTIVDVPPGTEKVRMDGVGGGSTETNWSRYSGVRRTRFIPERDEALPLPARQASPLPSMTIGRDSSTSVSVYDREREVDVDVDIERSSNRAMIPPPSREMWTEITKDLVCREAIEEMGYRYEETKWFFYIMDYLKYDEIIQLTELTARIRQHRRRYQEAELEREYMDDWYRRHPRHHYEHRARPHHREYDYEWDDERVREREVFYDGRGQGRGYVR